MLNPNFLSKTAITVSLAAFLSADPQIVSAAEVNTNLLTVLAQTTSMTTPGQLAGEGKQQYIELAQVQRRKRRTRRKTRRSRRRNTGAAAETARGAAAGIQGRYAVLRAKNKDAGCLVSLNRSGRAQVGPGCSDHSFQVFDPIRWSYSAGTLTLRGRSGHRVSFAKQPNGIWKRSPAAKKALSLKKY